MCARERVGGAENALWTAGSTNGRFWLALDDSNRTTFALGLMEGVSAFNWALDDAESGARTQFHKDTIELFRAPDFTVGDTVKEITRLYEDPANVTLPVKLIYPLAIGVFRGGSPEDIQRQLAYWRHTFASVAVSQ